MLASKGPTVYAHCTKLPPGFTVQKKVFDDMYLLDLIATTDMIYANTDRPWFESKATARKKRLEGSMNAESLCFLQDARHLLSQPVSWYRHSVEAKDRFQGERSITHSAGYLALVNWVRSTGTILLNVKDEIPNDGKKLCQSSLDSKPPLEKSQVHVQRLNSFALQIKTMLSSQVIKCCTTTACRRKSFLQKSNTTHCGTEV